jgi:hypothetical protein
VRAADVLGQWGQADDLLPAFAETNVEHKRELYVASAIVRAIGRHRSEDSRLLLIEALA